MKKCSVGGCDRKYSAKGLCSHHYYQTDKAKAKQKSYRDNPKNKEKLQERHHKQYLKNKERHNAKCKEWVEKNREKSREIKRRWKRNNPSSDHDYYERVKNTPEYKEKTKQYKIKNKENQARLVREWKKTHPDRVLESDRRSLQKVVYGLNYKDIPDIKSLQYALSHWAETVKMRDDKKCQICENDIKLQAHHILQKKYYPKLCLNPNNGVSLCEFCHIQVHGGLLNKLPNIPEPNNPYIPQT